MFMLSGVLALGATVSFILLTLAPEDVTGSATGPLATVAGLLMVSMAIVGAAWSVVHRKQVFPDVAPDEMHSTLPGVAEARARQRVREEYRSLARTDPVIATEMGVGRPDLRRPFEDGGLLDLNALGAPALSHFGQLPLEIAERIVAVRESQGMLHSVDELLVHTGMPPAVVARLREYAVFII